MGKKSKAKQPNAVASNAGDRSGAPSDMAEALAAMVEAGAPKELVYAAGDEQTAAESVLVMKAAVVAAAAYPHNKMLAELASDMEARSQLSSEASQLRRGLRTSSDTGIVDSWEAPGVKAPKYVDLLLAPNLANGCSSAQIRGEPVSFLTPREASLTHCSSDQLEAVAAFGGLCKIAARGSSSDVARSMSDQPASFDVLCVWLSQTPPLRESQAPPTERFRGWVSLKRPNTSATPAALTPPQGGPAYVDVLEEALELFSLLLSHRDAAERLSASMHFRSCTERLLELIGRWGESDVGSLPELALVGLHRACGVSVKAWEALRAQRPDMLAALAAAKSALKPTRTRSQKMEGLYKMCSRLQELAKLTEYDVDEADFAFDGKEEPRLEPPPAAEPSPAAQTVWLCGLVSRPELNGCTGVVLNQHAANGRVSVRIPNSTGAEDMLVRPANLQEPEEVPADVQQALNPHLQAGAIAQKRLDDLFQLQQIADRRSVAGGGARLEPLQRWLHNGGSPYALVSYHSGPSRATVFRSPLLHYVAQHSDAEALKMVLAASADVNYRTAEIGATPLAGAAAHAGVEIARMLLDARANIERAQSSSKDSALRQACLFGNEAFALELVARGANVRSGNPVADAAHAGLAACVRALVAKGAAVHLNLRADFDRGGKCVGGGSTPLHEASHRGHVATAAALLEAGAAPDARDYAEYTPLLVAVTHMPRSFVQLVEVLLNAGASVNACSDDGRTALWLSAKTGHEEAISLLIARGARVNTVTDFGSTPLCAAVHGRQLFAVQALLAAGARTDVPLQALTWSLKESSPPIRAAVVDHDMAESHLHRCGWCGTSAKCKPCGGCENAAYCGTDCQRADWRNWHKKVCKEGGKRPSTTEVNASLSAQARADLLKRYQAIDGEVAAACLEGHEDEVCALLSTDEMLRVLRSCRDDSPNIKRASTCFVSVTLLGAIADGVNSGKPLPTAATLLFLPELISSFLGICNSVFPILALRACATLAHTLNALKAAASKGGDGPGGDAEMWAAVEVCMVASAECVLRQIVRYLADDQESWERGDTCDTRAQAAGCACVCLFHITFTQQKQLLPFCAEAALRAGAAPQLFAAVDRYADNRAFAFATHPARRLYQSLLSCMPARLLLLEKLDIGIDCKCFTWAEQPKVVQRYGGAHVVAIDRILCHETGGCVQCLRRGLESCACHATVS